MSSLPYKIGKLTRTRTDGSKYWSFAISYDDGKGGRARFSLGTTDKVAADKAARDHWAKRTLRSMDTVGQCVEAYLATLPQQTPGWNNPASGVDHAGRTAIQGAVNKRDSWKQAAPFWSGLRMGDIDEQTSRDYLAWRKRSVNTMRSELSHIRTALNWAAKKGIIGAAPPIVVPAIPDSKVGHLTKPQFRKLVAGCKMPHVRLFAMLAVATGARKSALLQLRWSQIDLDRGMAFLNPEDREQNGKDRATVPLNDQIMQALCEARFMAESEYVIEYKGGPVADIKKGIKLGAERSGIDCHPHMFRHSAAVWMAEDRVPMEEIASFLGHRNAQITIKVYARFHPDYLRKAAKSLEW